MKRFILMMAAVLALTASCGERGYDPELSGSGFTIEADKLEILADGTDYAQITAKYGNKELTEDVAFYDASSNVPVSVKSMRFSTKTPGQYDIFATYDGKKSNVLSINALEYSVPAVPADPDLSKTSFRKRVLLTQFTSTGCTYCPIIVGLLRELSNDKVYSDRFVLGTSHADMTDYPNGDDPASFSGVAEFMSTFDVRGFPTLTADLGESLSNYDLTTLKALVDGCYSDGISAAGIAASSVLIGNTLVVRAAVKAGETGNYRIGAWLLEDGIYGKQTSAPDESYNTHNNCIRIINAGSSYMGHSVGRLAAGNSAEYILTFRNLDSQWKPDKCRLLLYVTSSVGNLNIVNNAVTLPLGGSVAYEYR